MNKALAVFFALLIALVAWGVARRRHRTEVTAAAATETAAGNATASAPAASGEGGCIASASEAFNAWGRRAQITLSGPPYDIEAWSAIRSDVDAKIDAASAACGCATDACTRNLARITDLRRQLSDFDASIRSGTTPAVDTTGTDRMAETLGLPSSTAAPSPVEPTTSQPQPASLFEPPTSTATVVPTTIPTTSIPPLLPHP